MVAVSSHERDRQIETGNSLISELSTAVSHFLPLKLSLVWESGFETAA